MNLTDADVLSHHKAGHVCGDDVDIVNGKPTGSIRVSFGYYSNKGPIKIILYIVKVLLHSLSTEKFKGNRYIVPLLNIIYYIIF